MDSGHRQIEPYMSFSPHFKQIYFQYYTILPPLNMLYLFESSSYICWYSRNNFFLAESLRAISENE